MLLRAFAHDLFTRGAPAGPQSLLQSLRERVDSHGYIHPTSAQDVAAPDPSSAQDVAAPDVPYLALDPLEKALADYHARAAAATVRLEKFKHFRPRGAHGEGHILE